jgi:4-hydroxybenzoate polyprenyltransferase
MWWKVGLVGLAFLGMLLRTRAIDEFKDFGHDAKNYPDRPVQRGLVSRGQVVGIGVVAGGVEILAIWGLGAMAVVYYLPVMVYSFLMAREFFVGEWLVGKFTLYFLLHQAIFLLMVVWAYMTFGVEFGFNAGVGMVVVMCVMAGAEIVRKFEVRRDKRGRVVKDTYVAVWGLDNARTVLAFMIGVPGVGLAILMDSVVPVVVAIVGVVGLEAWRGKTKYSRIVASGVFVVQGIVMVMI